MMLVRRFIDDEAGATAIEYGLIAALVAVGCITAFTAFGSNLLGLFNGVEARTTAVVAAGSITP